MADFTRQCYGELARGVPQIPGNSLGLDGPDAGESHD